MLPTQSPFSYFFDLEGSPLTGGYIYYGVENENPETSPATVYWDADGTQPATQPIKTLNGYPVRSGTPAQIFIGTAYSITVRDAKKRFIFSENSSSNFDATSILQADLAKDSGASLLGMKRTDLSSAVATTLALWHEKQWINARADYGITANGTADDSVLFQAMATDAASVGRVVYLGAGTFRLTTTITSTPVLYVGDGAGKTKIIFDTLTGINGFTFSASSTVGTCGGFIGVEFVAKGANGATAIECPKSGNQYDTYFTRWIFRDLYMRGYTRNASAYGFAWDYSFADWIRASDCDGLTIENVTIQGSFDIKLDPSPQFKDCGIKLDAATALMTGRIRNIAIGPIYKAIDVGDNVFFSVETFDLIGTYRGIYQTGTTEFSEPKIVNGNINCQETGIYLDSSSARDISSVTIRRHSSGWKSATNDWYGIKASNLASLTMSRNLVQPDESGGAFSGTMYAYALTAISQSAASDNTVGVGCDIGFQLDNCTGLNINGTVSNQNDAGNTLFNLVNNTRASAIGTYSLVSTFAGTLIAKDGTIVDAINMINKSFDLQGTGNINIDTTRVNAAADTKKWRQVTATTSQNRQVISDAGSATNYELVTRSGTTISSIEWRGTLLYMNGNFATKLPASVTPANNSDMSFQLTSNTQLTIKVKGTDGTVRSANITLA